ncbi:dTDP-4-dehydrorhamnose 3,5-epimerase [Halorubrum sp. HHNYT27]|uniref:dTDP-4-dehydrorhamnose 3,5-epimerase n=1 Tax=Halorubrum sp. HHNYT27 TaxID=3402275 RepID=UPI003EBBDEEB
MPFEFESTDINGPVVIKPRVFDDERGYLLESYAEGPFRERGLPTDFVLEFYSESFKDVLRGLHQQASPYEQAKIIRCFSGKIYDVVVDVRPGSETYGQYISKEISGENKHALYVPEGFLHGFATLSDSALVHYKVTNQFAPDHERGVRWDDPTIGINWPVNNPIISDKDQQLPTLQQSIYANQ